MPSACAMNALIELRRSSGVIFVTSIGGVIDACDALVAIDAARAFFWLIA
jgi:hypothetical protein